MKTPYSAIVITYPNGAQHVCKPNMQAFQGNWDQLAEAIARPYVPEGQKIKYTLK